MFFLSSNDSGLNKYLNSKDIVDPNPLGFNSSFWTVLPPSKDKGREYLLAPRMLSKMASAYLKTSFLLTNFKKSINEELALLISLKSI